MSWVGCVQSSMWVGLLPSRWGVLFADAQTPIGSCLLGMRRAVEASVCTMPPVSNRMETGVAAVRYAASVRPLPWLLAEVESGVRPPLPSGASDKRRWRFGMAVDEVLVSGRMRSAAGDDGLDRPDLFPEFLRAGLDSLDSGWARFLPNVSDYPGLRFSCRYLTSS